MGTYLWHLHLLRLAPRDPGWHWGWCLAWGQHIEVGTPAADKALLPALREWVPAVEAY